MKPVKWVTLIKCRELNATTTIEKPLEEFIHLLHVLLQEVIQDLPEAANPREGDGG